jgi:hypothetical protein
MEVSLFYFLCFFKSNSIFKEHFSVSEISFMGVWKVVSCLSSVAHSPQWLLVDLLLGGLPLSPTCLHGLPRDPALSAAPSTLGSSIPGGSSKDQGQKHDMLLLHFTIISESRISRVELPWEVAAGVQTRPASLVTEANPSGASAELSSAG